MGPESTTTATEPGCQAERPVVGETHAAGPAGGRTAHEMHQDFAHFVARIRHQVEGRLSSWLDARVAEARGRGSEVGLVADGVRQLTMRGGKRLRAVLLAATYEACGGVGGAEAVACAGAALELFQTYLLTHDDLIDGDEVRRGGPSLPARMREHFGAASASAMSILAGDLAGAWAQRLFLELELPPERVGRAALELARVHEDVIAGQVLDVRGAASDARAVEAMHALKTASYSVRGPVRIGARLAGASEDRIHALAAFAEPLGVAFQLRDDVLGLFGDPDTMGKSSNDLREGKRTALVVEALRDGSAAAALDRVLGRRGASDADVREAVARIAGCGALGRIEARIAELAADARSALVGTGLAPGDRALLEPTIDALTERRS
jgi:geranylgeranyl diphosphate synthase, type I